MWADQVAAFSGRRRVVAIDLPGHGRSTAAAGDYRLADLGQDILTVADAAGLDDFDLCGVSVGGLISLWLAVNAPGRVVTLVASNTAARVGTAEKWEERIAAVAEGGLAGILPTVVPGFVTQDFPARHPETYRSIETTFAAVDPVGYTGCCAALRDADLTDVVAAIACPTLVVAGDQDRSTSPADAEFLHDRIASSRLEVIRGAAHLASLDQPEAFNRAVLSAWNEWEG
jgi:3-oxoadipate enol-lactonase